MTISPESGATPQSSPKSRRTFLREAHMLRLGSERSQARLWSRHVNRPLGAIIAQALLGTRVSPNGVSIIGAVVTLFGAALVVASPAPAPIPMIVAVFVVWQLGLALDNADGLLARARGESSPFSAWLDQILDFVNHTAVIGSLVAFAARAFAFGTVEVAVLSTLVLAGSLIGLFASSQRNALLGTAPALGPAGQARLRIPYLALHLTDFGLFLVVSTAGLALALRPA